MAMDQAVAYLSTVCEVVSVVQNQSQTLAVGLTFSAYWTGGFYDEMLDDNARPLKGRQRIIPFDIVPRIVGR